MNKKKNTGKKVNYEIPKKGSLGLLALGDKGLRAWREVREKKDNDSQSVKK
jgi:hypothetical protein